MTDNRKDWLERRRSLLTASDCAAVLGVDSYRGPLAVYAAKVSDVQDENDNDWMAFGRDVEGAIANAYARKTGRPVMDRGATEIAVHADLPWLGATLDRVTSGTESMPAPIAEARADGPLELKSVGHGRTTPDAWRDDPPLNYVIQLQIQMACTGAQWGSLAALFPGYALAWRDMIRDDDFLNLALPKLEEFWLRVQRRDPPQADGTEGTAQAIKNLWRKEITGKRVELQPELSSVIEQWETAKKIKNDAEREVKQFEALIRAALQDAEVGVLPDRTYLTCKSIKKAAYSVQESEYRQLRRFTKKLLEENNK
jgi:putative phage-type endonuclease